MKQKEQFINIPLSVVKTKELTPTDKLLLGFVLGFSGKSKCTASNEFIAEYLNVAVRTIKRSLNKLESVGFIKRHNKFEFGRCVGRTIYKGDVLKKLGGANLSVSGGQTGPLVVAKRPPNNIKYHKVNSIKKNLPEKKQKNEPENKLKQLEEMNSFDLHKAGYRRDDEGKIIPRNDTGI